MPLVNLEDHLATTPGHSARFPVLATEGTADRIFGVIETLSGAVLITDQIGRIVTANRHACRLFGYGALAGLRVEDLLPSWARENHVIFRRVYSSAPIHRAMARYSHLWAVRADATEFCVQIELLPFWTTQGTWVAAIIQEAELSSANDAEN